MATPPALLALPGPKSTFLFGDLHPFGGGWHIGPFGDAQHPFLTSCRVVFGEFVLGRAGQGDIHGKRHGHMPAWNWS